MNANTWSRNQSIVTDLTPSPFRYNNFGGTIGGPMWVPGMNEKFREKLFFFVAEDWIRYRYVDYTTEAVPTTLMRQGNFSELLSSNPVVFRKPCHLPSFHLPGVRRLDLHSLPGQHHSRQPAEPERRSRLSTPTRSPRRASSVGTTNWIAQATHPINQRKGTVDIDILLNNKKLISSRRTDASYFEYQPFDQGSGLTGKYFNRPNQTNAIACTSTITPTLINEARLTLSIDDVYIPVNTALLGFNRCAFPINFPYLMPNGKDIPNKIPTVSVPNFYGLAGGPYPSHSSGTIWTGSDTLTKVWGNHTFKSGISLRVLRRERWRRDQREHGSRRRQQPERHLHLYRCAHRFGRHLRHRDGQPSPGPGRQLHRNRPALPHHLARLDVGRFRAGFLEGQLENCTWNMACAGPISRVTMRCGATTTTSTATLYNPATRRPGQSDYRQRHPGYRKPL